MHTHAIHSQPVNLMLGATDAKLWLSGKYTAEGQATDPHWMKTFSLPKLVTAKNIGLFSKSLTLGQTRAAKIHRGPIASAIAAALHNPPTGTDTAALAQRVENLATTLGGIISPNAPKRQINWASAVLTLAWWHLPLFIDTPNTRKSVLTWKDGIAPVETVEAPAAMGDYYRFLLACRGYMAEMIKWPGFDTELAAVTRTATDRSDALTALSPLSQPKAAVAAKEYITRRLFDKVCWHEGVMLR